MAGRGEMTDADREQLPRVIKLDDKNHWVPAADPLHAERGAVAGVGPGMTFARYMSERNEEISIGLIPCAVRGSSLKRWGKNGDLYRRAVTRAKIAMKVGTLKGILWHHGEFDARRRLTANTYRLRMIMLIEDLRRDLKDPRLPLVVGRLGEFIRPNRLPYAHMVNNGIDKLPKDIKFMRIVQSTSFSRKPYELESFNAPSAREFGRRYARAMIEVQREYVRKKINY
jgi:hypothetical protein